MTCYDMILSPGGGGKVKQVARKDGELVASSATDREKGDGTGRILACIIVTIRKDEKRWDEWKEE